MQDGYIQRARFAVFRKQLALFFKSLIPSQTINFGLKSLREKELFHMKGRISNRIPSVKGRDKLVNPHFLVTLWI